MTRLLAPVGLPIARARDRLTRWTPLVLTDDSGYVTVAPGTAPAYSSWTQMVATTTVDTHYLELTFGNIGAGGVNTASIYEVGIGGAGAETAILSGLLGYGALGSTNGPGKLFQIPVYIPKGSRVTVRATCATAGRSGGATQVRLYAPRWPMPRPATPVTLTTAPDGTTCIGSITNTTDTAYAEVTAASPLPLVGVAVTFGLNGTTGATALNNQTLTVGVGGAGAEVALSLLPYGTATSETVWCQQSIAWGDIPAGARIAVKKSTATHTHDYHIYGIPRP